MTDEAALRTNVQQQMDAAVPLRVWIIAEPFHGDLAHPRMIRMLSTTLF